MISVSVYQLQASSLIPTGTDEAPVLVIFLAVLVVMINFSVVITMLNLKIHYGIQSSHPPKWLLDPSLKFFSKIFFCGHDHVFHVYKDAKDADNKKEKECKEKGVKKVQSRVIYKGHSLSLRYL